MEQALDHDTFQKPYQNFYTAGLQKMHRGKKDLDKYFEYLLSTNKGFIIFSSSMPISPFSPACGFSPSTAIRGDLILNSFIKSFKNNFYFGRYVFVVIKREIFFIGS